MSRRFPSRTATPTSVGTPWFEERAAAAGVDFRLGRASKPALTVLEVMGAGCAVADFDGDGWDDLFFVGQEGFGHSGKCALFLNRKDGTFADATAGSGLEAPGYYMGCATADIDDDGHVDLFVSGYGVNRLYRNLGPSGGRIRFQDITKQAGLQVRSPVDFTSGVAFGDYDGDGRADFYLGRYIVFTSKLRQHCSFATVLGACPPWVYDPQLGSLYRNLGGNRFRDVTRDAGMEKPHGKTLGVIWGDYNKDGRPDLYLANDGVAGDLFQNLGGNFRNVGPVSGAAYNSLGATQAGMGVDLSDFNGDGWQDLVVTTFRLEPTSLYGNREGAYFDHVSQAVGLDIPTRARTGFGTRLVDLDNDGWPDLATANGHVLEKEELVDRFSSYKQAAQLFMNEEGRRFTDRSAEAGPGFTLPAVGRGLATGDFDRDGKLDLVMTDLEGPARLFMNRIPRSGAWMGFRLVGDKSNRLALGAVVTVEVGGRTWLAECRSGSSYYSASSPVVHLGLGITTGPAKAAIRWPSGATTKLEGLAPNRYYTVDETRGLLR